MLWRVCERFGMRPPGVSESFDKCTAPVQAQLLAFEQIREQEEAEGSLL